MPRTAMAQALTDIAAAQGALALEAQAGSCEAADALDALCSAYMLQPKTLIRHAHHFFASQALADALQAALPRVGASKVLLYPLPTSDALQCRR